MARPSAAQRQLEEHVIHLRGCTLCPKMHRPAVSGGPVLSRVMIVGQAPGTKEPILARPFAWTAGKTLFGWFEKACGMTEAEFRAVYRHTPVVRTKRRGLARNAAVALGNIGTDRDIPVLRRALTEHDEPLVRGHAAWALARLAGCAAQPDLERRHRLDPDEAVRGEIAFAVEHLAIS